MEQRNVTWENAIAGEHIVCQVGCTQPGSFDGKNKRTFSLDSTHTWHNIQTSSARVGERMMLILYEQSVSYKLKSECNMNYLGLSFFMHS